jgi:sugar lactone lactonase YvrE
MRSHQLELLADGFVFPEGPRWHQGKLWLSDMWDFGVYRLSLDGRRERIADVPQRPSGLAFLPDGTPLVVSMVDRRILKIIEGTTVEFANISEIVSGDANDMSIAPDGRIYVSSFGYDIFKGAPPRLANIALIEPDGTARVAITGVDFPNGMLVVDGGRRLVVAETWASRLVVYDRAEDGTLHNRQIHTELGTRTPDGLCQDCEGGIWVSSFLTDEFIRVTPDGVISDRVSCPGRRAVACELGGADGRTLFCLTFAGNIDDIVARKRAGAAETARVEVPGRAGTMAHG